MKTIYRIIFLALTFSASIINAQFSNYSKNYNWALFTTYSNGGGGSVTLNINNNILSLNFSGGFTETTLKQGKVVPTDYAGNLPNTEIPIPSGNFFTGKGYRFFIVDNHIAIYHNSPLPLTNFTGTISVNLTTPVTIPTDISTYLTNWTSQNKVTAIDYMTDQGATGKKKTSIIYYDGLGRELQIVAKGATPLGKDLVMYSEYDSYGRKAKDFLPIPTTQNNGLLVDAATISNLALSVYNGEPAFSEKVFEASPLNRVLMQASPGTAWKKDSGHEIKYDHNVNTISDGVKKYDITLVFTTDIYNPQLSFNSFYNAGSLIKKVIKDEEWKPTSGNNNTIEEFVNNEGQTILKRQYIDGQKVDTYYLYDSYGNLTYVIPPLASDAVKNLNTGTFPDTTLNDLCYQYKYDKKNRLVEKKLPGKGVEYMVYDKADRLIMTQDAELRKIGKWLLTKYDQFGRVIYTGIIPGVDRPSLQVLLNNYVITESRNAQGFTKNGMQIYYTNDWCNEIETVLSVNYYDTYPAYSFNPAFPSNVFAQTVLTDNSSANSVSTKGLPVMSLVKNIEDDNWTKNYTYYDTKGRVISTHSINHLGGFTRTSSDLDFSGTVKQTLVRHTRLATDTERSIRDVFTYDTQNRLLTHTHQVGTGAIEYLAQNKYNELSQLESKKVGGSVATPLQQVDYKYNIRGWMTQINDPTTLGSDLFGYAIRYNSPLDPTGQASFNGNITEIDWNTKSDITLRRYDYYYDTLNRFNFAQYTKPNSSVPQTGSYNEWTTYDLNGNIKTMGRYGNQDTNTPISIDNLQYTYSGNRLLSIKDTSQNLSGYPYLATPNTISYDDNGNMTSHPDKNINEITYNYLNLPNSFKQLSEGRFRPSYNYIYRADGVKIRKNATPGISINIQTDYLDGFQYSLEVFDICAGCTIPNPVLQLVPTSEGYYDFVKNKYIYNYSDHLGNVRVSYLKGTLGLEVIEENNYYPFGLKHEGYNNLGGNPAYQYKYNGKELQTETGMYDYGARFYMPDVGRWGVVDPLSEKMRRYSPYNYAFGNPIRFIDPDGMQNKDWRNKNGQLVYDPKANSGKGAYTEYATSNDRNLGDGLRNSGDTGIMQFQALVNSSHPITVDYDIESTSNDKGGYQLGITGNAIEGQKINTKTNEVVDVIISQSNITINIGVISEFVSDIRSGKQNATEKGEKIIKNNTKISVLDVAIAALGHEIGHTQSQNQTDKANGKDKEAVPTQIAEQILQDISNKKNNEKP